MRGGPRRSVAFRLPIDLLGRLDAECDERVVGRNLIVERALEEYLDRLDAQHPLPGHEA